MSRIIKYVAELERRYTSLKNKCETQETVIESLSKNYSELKRKHDKAAMHYWMYWFKMDEESAEDLEDKEWYLIIVPDFDYLHPVIAQYMGKAKCFRIMKSQHQSHIIHRDLVNYWADLPEPDLFNAVENKEEK